MNSRASKTLWRISNYPDLNGEGGLRSPGRWHSRGHKVAYLADSPSTALLETLVHLELDEGTYPDPRKLLEVSVPEDCLVVSLDLPEAGIWVDDLELTRRLGTDWLRSLASPLAIVPSVIVSEARNYLLNPVHPDAARITIISERWQTFDRRLFRLAHH